MTSSAGTWGPPAASAGSFDRKGVIVIDNEDGDLDEETVMMDALDCGASDVEADGPVFEITCDPDSFNDVTAALEAKGYAFVSAAIEMVPQNYVKLTNEEDIKNMTRMIELMEDNDDIQNVYHNWDQEYRGFFKSDTAYFRPISRETATLWQGNKFSCVFSDFRCDIHASFCCDIQMRRSLYELLFHFLMCRS